MLQLALSYLATTNTNPKDQTRMHIIDSALT